MIYPEADLATWLKRTRLEVVAFRCPNCEGFFPVNVPVICYDYIGLESPVHACGPRYTGVQLVPRSKEKIKLWRKLITG